MPDDILSHLRAFTARERISLPHTAAEVPEIAAYEPIGKYLSELARDSKPERAAEDLFVALARDVAKLKSIPQVNVGDGFVDFIIGGEEHGGGGVVVELKPLFKKYDDTRLNRFPIKAPSHLDQIKKYLRKHEYVALTDLRTAYLYSARDCFVTNSFFAELPFADLLDRAGQQLNLTEVLRSAEDAEEKPDLDRQFFEDLSEWFHGFRNVDWKQPADAAELTILLLNKLIFAKTLEDHGLVPYRFLQDEFEKQEDRWETKGPHRVVKAFLHEFEPFFDEYYDTELFERKIWDELDHDHENLQRFCGTLKRILGITTWDKILSRRGVVNYNYRTINEDIFGKSYEMFLAANRKDEGIYYTPASITVPMTRSLVASVFGPLTDEICAACHPDVCDFAKARTAFAKLAELRITDTAAGSGGFLIKVLREIWAQYLRIEKALGWVDQIKLEGDLFDQPKNIRKAAEFREDSQLSDTRRLLLGCVVRHLNGRSSAPRWMQLVIKTNLMREVIRLAPQEFHFRRFPGSRRALSELSGWSIKRKIRLRAGRVVC